MVSGRIHTLICRPFMDQLIEFYIELGTMFAENKLKQILRAKCLSRRTQHNDLTDAVTQS